MSQTWPLVGRDDELRFVLDALGDSGGRGVVLVGPPGVGKTRLAQEAVAVARAQGAVTITINATPALSGIPLGALAPWLPDSAMVQSDRSRTLARGCAALAARADGAALLLYVDDANLLDPLSAALVHQTVVSGAASLLATVRRGSSTPDELTALWTAGDVERLEVTGLSRHDHDRLVEFVLGGTVHGPTLERLWQITAGNVLFLRVVIDTALSAGDLAERASVWRLRGPIRPGPVLIDLVELRLGTLDAAAELVIEHVAFSEPVDLELIAIVTSESDLERAERTGTVIAFHDEGRVRLRLAHPLYGEVVRARTPLLRANAIRRRLADALDGCPDARADDVLALATWRLAAGDDCDLDILVAASRLARDRFDYQLAVHLASAAVTMHGGPEAALIQAHCLSLAGRFAEAEAVFASVDAELLDDRTLADTAVTRATNLMWGLGDFPAADGLMTACARAMTDPAIIAELQAQHARVALAAGALTRALEVTGTVMSRADADPMLRLVAAVGRVPALAIAGRTGEALALIGTLPFTLDRLGEHPLEVCSCAVSEVTAHWFAGDLARAGDVAAALYESAVAVGYWEAICDGARLLASVELARGRPRSAIRWAREALASIPDGDRPDLVCWCLAVLSEAMAVAGDSDLGSTLSKTNASRHPAIRIFDAQIVRANAWAAAMAGELSLAVSTLADGATDARDAGAFAVEVLLLHDVVRLDRSERACERLAELAVLVGGPWATVCADHAAALLTHDADSLEQVAAEFGLLGAGLLAAEAEMQAARAHRRRGAERRRRTAASLAEALADRCEGARTPALSIPESVVPLTRRELEIAALAGQGLPSPEIARRLTVSTRTVEGHLHRMYAKLGVSRREELADHLPA